MREDLVWPVDESCPEERLKMEKVTVPVELLLDGGERLAGNTFLLPLVESVSRRERVIDLVTAEEPFLPLAAGGELRFVNKRRVVMVRVPDSAEAGLDELTESCLHAARVSIRLSGVEGDGSSVEAEVRWNAPAERARLLDHLNDAGPWLAAETSGGLAIIATRFVLSVSPIDDPARPA